MTGAGNRILVVDQRGSGAPAPDADTLRRLGDPATGPGFDQLMWLTAPLETGSHAAYRVFNNDGSEVEQCGNGLRCVARVVAEETGTDTLRLDSPAGPVDARLLKDGQIAVSMGEPEFEPAAIPFIADSQADRYAIDLGERTIEASVLSMGNPHCVLDVDIVKEAPVASLGAQLEVHPRFPDRVNVGFRAIRSRSAVDLRVFERGVGETLACGTGACAAVVAGQVENRLDETVSVSLPGGQLMVSWRGPGNPVWLSGDAELQSEGTLNL